MSYLSEEKDLDAFYRMENLPLSHSRYSQVKFSGYKFKPYLAKVLNIIKDHNTGFLNKNIRDAYVFSMSG